MLSSKIELEHHRICEKIASLTLRISQLPKGKLICTHSGSYTKWYQSIDHVKSYISKKDRFLAEQLAYKQYLSNQLTQLQHEKYALELYLRHHKEVDKDNDSLLTASDPYFDLLTSSNSHFSGHSLSQADFIQQWLHEPYSTNPSHPENLIHRTHSGILVRSKSESLIASTLFRLEIPFRYECALELGGQSIYPDFTILHPRTCELFYYEHFGMMDDADYLNHALSKLRLYIENGIYPTVNLLLSFETQAHPLDSNLVEEILHYYFK